MTPKSSRPPLKLPWKNSWFQLAVITSVFSAGLLISDFGKGHSISIPHVNLPVSIFAKPGSLLVTSSDPVKAEVHIDGQTDQPTPANFSLKPGSYQVVISAPGYDSDTKTVEIKEAQPSSLDEMLNRAYGSVNLKTVPSRLDYRLVGTSPGNDKVYEGTTPANINNLPPDTYKLSFSGGDMDSHEVSVDVVAHQTTSEIVDLVRLNLASEASPAVSKALQGQSQPSSLSDSDKQDYIGLMNRAFQQYLRSRSFGLASDAISALKGAGANTQDQEKDLADARNDYQQTLSSQIKDMIADGRFGAARSKIAALKDVAPPDMVDAINSEFQDQMSSYEKQADDAVNASSVGDPAAAFNQLKIFADQHPDDINLQLALGHLLTRMPPDHTRLSNQLDAFKSFNRTILDTAELSDLNALETRIQNELATYDRLAAQLDAAKGGSGGGSSIKELQREIAHDQASIAAADGVNSAVDTLTSSFLHTHVRVVNVSEKKDEIAEDNAKINQIEASQQNSQGAVAAAQRQFDAFCATVPW
jgi:hypothetical protein